MTKTDGTPDKPLLNLEKNQTHDAKTNDINRHYEKALNTPEKQPRDTKNSRALNAPREKQIHVTEKKLKERRENRINNQKTNNRQNRFTNKRNNKSKNILDRDNNDDDNFDTHQDNNSLKKHILIDSDSNSDSDSDSDNHHDDNDKNDTNNTHNSHYEYKNHSDNQFINPVNLEKTQEQQKNTQEYLEFLRNFVAEFDKIPDNEIIIQKAIVQDTITQMFDQFLVGMNNFDKTTKQHHVFGAGVHLCQKILISLKNNNMSDALSLIKRIIPKEK